MHFLFPWGVENNCSRRSKAQIPKSLYFRYEAPVAPNLEVLRESALEAFPTAIVGFAVAFSVAKVYAIKHDYSIDGNQVSITAYNMTPRGQTKVSWSQSKVPVSVIDVQSGNAIKKLMIVFETMAKFSSDTL